MTLRLTAAFILLLCVGGFGLAAAIKEFAIVDAVNARLPPTEQFDPFWWGPLKTFRLHREYRRLYPNGNLLSRQGVLATIMLFCTVLAGVLIGLGFLAVAWLGGGGALLLWFTYFRKPSTL